MTSSFWSSIVIASEKAHPAGTAALGRAPALGTGQIVEVFDCNTPSQELRGLIGTGQIDPSAPQSGEDSFFSVGSAANPLPKNLIFDLSPFAPRPHLLPAEGCAAILWRHRSHAPEPAEALKLTAVHLKELDLIDEVTPEPLGGAHQDHELASQNLRSALLSLSRSIDEETNRRPS
jgi:hypothetical protein